MVHIVFLLVLLCMIPQLNRKYPFYIFGFIILLLFMSLRYNYGNDYKSYENMHYFTNNGYIISGESDYLFSKLMMLIKNFDLFILVISVFYLLVIFTLIKNNLSTKQYWFAIIILLSNPYLFLIHLSSLRQTLAICFFIIAVVFAKKRKISMYILCVLLASGMHSSAIILLPLYFILNEKKFKSKWIIFTYILIFTLLFTPFFNVILNFSLDYLPKNYIYYINQGNQNSIRATLISSFFLFLISFNLKKMNINEVIYAKLSLLSAFLSVLSIKISMLTRVGMYFDIFLIITLPQIFMKIENKIYRLSLLMLLFFILLLRYYSFFSNPTWASFRSYKTILGR